MTDPISVDFARLQINLNTYNKILKKAFDLLKEAIMKKYLRNLRMT